MIRSRKPVLFISNSCVIPAKAGIQMLAAAKNYVEYANEEGSYDEIRDYLAGAGGKRRMGF